jgi:CxxC motif-containing protein
VTTETYLCIGCPLGCRLEVEEAADGHVVEVRGFSCKRGREYALQEHSAPQRMVTTTVHIDDAHNPRLPVRTTAPVPKDAVVAVCQALRHIAVQAPIHLGEIVLPNVLGLGVDVIASRTMAAR